MQTRIYWKYVNGSVNLEGRCLFRPRSTHFCHQKPNPARVKVSLTFLSTYTSLWRVINFVTSALAFAFKLHIQCLSYAQEIGQTLYFLSGLMNFANLSKAAYFSGFNCFVLKNRNISWSIVYIFCIAKEYREKLSCNKKKTFLNLHSTNIYREIMHIAGSPESNSYLFFIS